MVFIITGNSVTQKKTTSVAVFAAKPMLVCHGWKNKILKWFRTITVLLLFFKNFCFANVCYHGDFTAGSARWSRCLQQADPILERFLSIKLNSMKYICLDTHSISRKLSTRFLFNYIAMPVNDSRDLWSAVKCTAVIEMQFFKSWINFFSTILKRCLLFRYYFFFTLSWVKLLVNTLHWKQHMFLSYNDWS